jgi:hypothetical protein
MSLMANLVWRTFTTLLFGIRRGKSVEKQGSHADFYDKHFLAFCARPINPIPTLHLSLFIHGLAQRKEKFS